MGNEISSSDGRQQEEQYRFEFTPKDLVKERYAEYVAKIRSEIVKASHLPTISQCHLCGELCNGMFILPCFHGFCKDCYSMQLSKTETCPICKKYKLKGIKANLTQYVFHSFIIIFQ